MDSFLDTQVGGEHYKSLQMQPIVLIAKTNCDYIQGRIIELLARCKCTKNKEDLLKKTAEAMNSAVSQQDTEKLDLIMRAVSSELELGKYTLAELVSAGLGPVGGEHPGILRVSGLPQRDVRFSCRHPA